MNNMPCEVIKDLLPSYIDELTSEASNRLIEEHLAECENCRETLNSMKEGSPISPLEEKTEIDFLKKNRRKNKWILSSCIAVILIIFGVLFVSRYMVGEKITDTTGDYINWDIKVDGNRVELDALVTQDIYKITRFTYDVNNGVLNVGTNVVPSGRVASLIYGKEFHSEYTSPEPFNQIAANGRILWDNGNEIEGITSRLYQVSHDFEGYAANIGEIARPLNIFSYLGYYILEYELKEPPLGWIFHLVHDIPAAKQELCEEHMASYSYAMMAVINNLDRVIWKYSVDGQTVIKIITEEDASAFLGQDIKNCYEDVSLLNELIRKTDLDRYAYGYERFEGNYIPDGSLYSFTLPVTIVCHTDEPIAGITVSLFINGKLTEIFEAENADHEHTLIEKGDLTYIWIGTELFENAVDSNLELYFTIHTSDGKAIDISDNLQIPWNSNTQLFDLQLYGNPNDGFYVTQ